LFIPAHPVEGQLRAELSRHADIDTLEELKSIGRPDYAWC
jgi:hypothetical protein